MTIFAQAEPQQPASLDIFTQQHPSDSFLLVAANAGHMQLLQLLLARCADFNQVNFEGQTALDIASTSSCECVQLLLACGAHPFRTEGTSFCTIRTAVAANAATNVHLMMVYFFISYHRSETTVQSRIADVVTWACDASVRNVKTMLLKHFPVCSKEVVQRRHQQQHELELHVYEADAVGGMTDDDY